MNKSLKEKQSSFTPSNSTKNNHDKNKSTLFLVVLPARYERHDNTLRASSISHFLSLPRTKRHQPTSICLGVGVQYLSAPEMESCSGANENSSAAECLFRQVLLLSNAVRSALRTWYRFSHALQRHTFIFLFIDEATTRKTKAGVERDAPSLHPPHAAFRGGTGKISHLGRNRRSCGARQ